MFSISLSRSRQLLLSSRNSVAVSCNDLLRGHRHNARRSLIMIHQIKKGSSLQIGRLSKNRFLSLLSPGRRQKQQQLQQQYHHHQQQRCYNNNNKSNNESGGRGGQQQQQQQVPPGNMMIIIGFGLLGLVIVEQYMQYRQEKEEKSFRAMMLTEINSYKRNEMKIPKNWDIHSPTKFCCKIIMTDSVLDGNYILRGIQIGDQVEVIEEGVGPNGTYHLCRFWKSDDKNNNNDNNNNSKKDANSDDINNISVGWYPIKFLEKI